jgi:hypothetical protein
MDRNRVLIKYWLLTNSPFEELVPRIHQSAEKREGQGDVY